MTPAKLVPKSGDTVPALLLASALRAPERPALWRYVDVRFEPVGYGALMRAADRIARQLQGRGIQRGQQVVLAITDRFTWAVAFLGVQFSGATAVPVDPLLRPGEIVSIVKTAEAALLIHDGCIDIGDAGEVCATLTIDAIWPGFDGTGPLDGIRLPEVGADDIAEIIFTSGTTGKMKGVMLSHGNLVGDIRAIDAMGLLNDHDMLLSILPIHHSFESTAGLLYPLSIGAQVAYARSLKSNEIIADLRTTKATIVLGVPLLFENIVNSINRKLKQAPPVKRRLVASLMALSRAGRKAGWSTAGRTLLRNMRVKAGLDSIRLMVSGGAALPAHVAEFLDTIGLPLLQGYGLTETSPVLTVNRPGKYRYDTVGPPLPDTEITIIDPGSDGIGEIAARGPMVMKGYWKMPEETAAVFRDGWLLTGDLGSIEPDGHVKISGRSKNIIVTGAGKNVYPEEIEALMVARDEILELVVYGLTRPGKIGETVAAVIVPDAEWYRENNPATWQDETALFRDIERIVREECEKLAPFKRIASIEIRRDPFEKTSTRKIKRHLVTKGKSELYGSAATLWPRDRG
ncbi:MAG: AMP-binding protein [Candidatus Zixiibacteriota bacterium]